MSEHEEEFWRPKDKEWDPQRKGVRVQTVNLEPSKTHESAVDQAELNVILKRYKEVGVQEQMRRVDMQFRDVSEFTDYHDMMQRLEEARAVFMSNPPEVRQLFDHKVEKWLDAAHDPEKMKALEPDFIRLGLMDAPEPPPESPPTASDPAETPPAAE